MAKTTKAFTKGQLVTRLAQWDHEGTVTYRHAVVYSCGVKRMVLTDAVTGEEIGRNFRPEIGDVDNVPAHGWEGTFPRMTDEEAAELSLKVAAKIITALHEHYAERLAKWGDDRDYAAAMRAQEARIHEPRAIAFQPFRAPK